MSEDTAVSNPVEELFLALTKDGTEKNAIIMALATQCSLDVTTAVREYQRLVKQHGMVLNVKDRTVQIDLMLVDHDITDANVRRSLVEQIADRFDISEATAMQHIRSYAEANQIELPAAVRTPFADLVAFVKERTESMSRAEIAAALVAEFGYSENSANSAVSRVFKELGLATGRAGATYPLSDLVTLIRNNVNLSKKELLALIVDTAGYAESTANSFLIYLNFAKEYAKQELEAAALAQPSKKRAKAEA